MASIIHTLFTLFFLNLINLFFFLAHICCNIINNSLFVLQTLATSNSWLAEHLWIFFFFGLGDANKQTWKIAKCNVVGNDSFPYYRFPASTLSPSPSCTCNAGYLLIDGSIMSEEFFKAAYYANLTAEQQGIRLKKEFIAWFIYILFCFNFCPSGQHVKNNS